MEPNPMTSIQTGIWASTWLACVSALRLRGRWPLLQEVWAAAAAELSVSPCSCPWWWSHARSCRAGWPGAGSGWRRVGIWPAGWSPSWPSPSCWAPRTTRGQSCGSCGLLRRTCCSCSPENAPWTYSHLWTIPGEEGEKGVRAGKWRCSGAVKKHE